MIDHSVSEMPISDFLFIDGFMLAPLSKQIQRTTYDVFAVFGDIGGISSVILTVTAALIATYAALLFKIDAI